LLTEEFQVGELPKGYGKGFGVFDAEGNLEGEFSNEADAKRFMDQKNAELRAASGEAGTTRKNILKKLNMRAILGWLSGGVLKSLLVSITAFMNYRDIEKVFIHHADWLRNNHCVEGKSFDRGRFSTKDFEMTNLYAHELGEQLTETVIQILVAFVGGAIAVARVAGILSKIPGTPAWVFTAITWAGASAAVMIINKLLEHPKTYPVFFKFFTNASRILFLDENYLTNVCNTDVDVSGAISDLVPDWVPLINESTDLDIDETNFDKEFETIWNDIYADPEVQAAYKQALENKKSGITP
jgi:hypothetical protein